VPTYEFHASDTEDDEGYVTKVDLYYPEEAFDLHPDLFCDENFKNKDNVEVMANIAVVICRGIHTM
jgi:hypothetical protein